VVSVLNERCPGFVDQIPGNDARHAGFSTRLWRDLLGWMEGHHFARATSDVDLDAVRAAARTHLRGERIAAYWAIDQARWRLNPAVPRFRRMAPGGRRFRHEVTLSDC
jgi:hypothetical protein